MRKNIFLGICALAFFCIAVSAFAHTGHDAGHDGFSAGFLHPLSGADHLLVMLLVGVWAAQLGGRAIWIMPLTFLTAMTVGALMAIDGASMASIWPSTIETGIAISLLTLGLLVTWTQRLPVVFATALAGLFALFHGAAHGSELPAFADPVRYALGFLVATALLHIAGVVFGIAIRRRAPDLARVAGAIAAAVGAAFLVG